MYVWDTKDQRPGLQMRMQDRKVLLHPKFNWTKCKFKLSALQLDSVVWYVLARCLFIPSLNVQYQDLILERTYTSHVIKMTCISQSIRKNVYTMYYLNGFAKSPEGWLLIEKGGCIAFGREFINLQVKQQLFQKIKQTWWLIPPIFDHLHHSGIFT